MLVLARKVGQTVVIADDIEVTIAAIRGDQVRLAIRAPRSVNILRKEAIRQIEAENLAAVNSAAEWLSAPRPETPPSPTAAPAPTDERARRDR